MRQLRIGVLLLSAALSAAGCADLHDTLGAEAPAALAASSAGPPSRLREGQYSFNRLSDEHLWIYVANSDNLAVIGLTRPGLARGVWRGKVLLERAQWREAERAVAAHPGVELVSSDSLLPRVTVRIRDAAALAGVRRLPFIDYVEPVTVPAPTGGAFASGCSQTEFSNRDNIVDGEVIAGSLRDIGVVAAWRRSNGAGTTIGLVDSGISPGQDELDVYFNDGQSSGRTLRLLNVIPGNWQDCKHGVKMAGLMVAPKNGRYTVGVAWKANFVDVRTADRVFLVSASDAANGIRAAASNMVGGRRIVVMAFQSINWLWQVSDEIDYWHYNYGALFIGAAGTSQPDLLECAYGLLWPECEVVDNANVVFPADKGEVFAVTASQNASGGLPSEVHYGPEVQIQAPIPQATSGWNHADIVRLKGSSAASAVVGGIAALIWSRYPHFTRNDVMQRIRESGNSWPNKSQSVGYGVVNAYKATGGLTDVFLEGPVSVAPNSTFTMMVKHFGDGPTYTYNWSNGVNASVYHPLSIQTGSILRRAHEVTFTAGSAVGTSMLISVTVTDGTDGTAHTVSKWVAIQEQPTWECVDPSQPCCNPYDPICY